MGSISLTMKSDYKNKEELSKALGIDGCMIDLVESGGEFKLLLQKAQQDQMEKQA